MPTKDVLMNRACAVGAEVALTPLPHGEVLHHEARCLGRPAPRASNLAGVHGLGALITVTSDKLNAENTLRALLATDEQLALRMVLVTVDFKDKSDSAEAVAQRRAWAQSNADELKQMSQSLQKISGGASVLVELVDMASSCMSKHLSQLAFNGYGNSGCGSQRASSCNASGFWKNTVAFSWGLARLSSCVRHVVHVDNDIHLRRATLHKGQQKSVAWVRRALGVLQASDSLLSVHPLRGPGACSFTSESAGDSDGCSCRLGRDPNSGGLVLTRSTRLPKSSASAAACLLTYEGPHKPGVPHFSIQAFVMDLQRFQQVWPLTPSIYSRPHGYGPYSRRNATSLDAARADWLERFELRRGIRRDTGKVDPESIFEENARARGLDIVYMAAAELGVSKLLTRGRLR